MKKKKYIAIFRSFEGLDGYLVSLDFLIKKLSKEFDKIFIINIDNLRFFSSNKEYKFYDKVKELPSNIELYNPLNTDDFEEFIKDKSLIGITVVTREFKDLKVHYLFKKFSIPRLYISPYAHDGMSQIVSFKSPIKAISYKIYSAFKSFYVLLSFLGIIRGEDIRFMSEKKVLNNIQNNKFKNFLYKNNLNFAKEIIIINSRNYDLLYEKKLKKSEEFIVHIDASLNYYSEVELRGELSEEVIKNHYFYLEKFLEKLSNEFNKEVIVCIHPSYDTDIHQKHLPKFNVVKFKTPEYLYRSFLVTNFDSSSIADAVILKKRIIGLISNFMSKNEISHAISQASRNGYICLNTKEDLDFDKNEILKKLNIKVNGYDLSKNHCHEPNTSGTDKIIRIIKERYF